MVNHDRYFLDQVNEQDVWRSARAKIYVSYELQLFRGFLELKAAREENGIGNGAQAPDSVLRMALEWAKRGCRARNHPNSVPAWKRLEALKKRNGTR